MFDLKLSAVAFSRRAVLNLAASAAVAGLLVSMLPGSAIAQRQKGPAEVPVEELMKPGVLADVSLGPADAKVTVVEYASLTCPHCAHFTNQVFPDFRKKYIDTGKVHYIFRGFALNPLDQAAQMLVQCLGGEKRLSMIEVFFAKQADWAATSGNPVPKLFDLAKQAGFTQGPLDACLKDAARPVQRRSCSTISRPTASTPAKLSASARHRPSSSTASDFRKRRQSRPSTRSSSRF